jgi:hypothetical protein
VVAERNNVQLAFCWSLCSPSVLRTRCRGTSGDCHRSPQQIAKLYAAEKDIRCRGSDERRAVG